MICIAEYFVLNKEFPKDSCFDLDTHRSRVGFSFFSYAMGKQVYDYDSEIEYGDNGNEDPNDYVQNVKPKKRKVTKAFEPKKKMAKGSRKNKETKDYIEIL